MFREQLISVGIHITKLIDDQLQAQGRDKLQETLSLSLQGQIGELHGSHSVVQLIRKRTNEFLVSLMTSRQPSQQIRIPPGLSSMEREFALFCRRFLRLTTYNRSVFGEYYSKIISELLQDRSGNQPSEATAS